MEYKKAELLYVGTVRNTVRIPLFDEPDPDFPDEPGNVTSATLGIE